MCDSMITRKIIDHGIINVPSTVIRHAETIRHENYKVNTPTKFRKHTPHGYAIEVMLAELGDRIGEPVEKLDFVYFSVCRGAEPHVDQLDPTVFTDTTYVIPLVLPPGSNEIIADGEKVSPKLGHVYQFDHTQTHSMTVSDTESGCVVAMIAVKKCASTT